MTGLRPLSPRDARRWGKHAHGSPLYAHLIEVVASDWELMRVLNLIEHTPRPNVMLASIQYLLLKGEGPELARFYRSLVEDPAPTGDVAIPFKDFVAAHEIELVELGRTRYTQTNECRRCTALLPAIWEAGMSRFHLVDIGASAGLNLAIDLYSYRWDGLEWGQDSPVLLETELRGRVPHPRPIEVLSRTGLDLHPIDPSDPDDRLWLEALVWPEHEARRRRLRSALELASKADIELIPGSALDTLEGALEHLAGDDPVVIMNSFTLNQFSPQGRDQVGSTIEAARGRRPVARVFFEHMHRDDDWPSIGIDTGAGPTVIGRGHPHGEWLEIRPDRRRAPVPRS